ncbi:hypothetical protein H2200_002535 [Cladophialophora chaetospira]|uniref:Uncharacterized protein n=1 Tax=Cladophialophora chaetospira TaxID=386627 RepID=A0AA38XJ64_9EURO|nr:hypothetical protein H2200_002535 [Cladophialophora chaetospira]
MSEQISLFSGRNGLSLHSENTSILGWASASVGAEDQDAEDELGDEHEDAQGHLHEESVDDQPCEAEPDHDAHKDTIIRQILDGIPANEYLYMADKLESFCFGTDLISVRDEATDVSRRPSAWLYDRNSSGEVHRSRPDKGVLSPCRLDEELSKIRFPSVAYDTQADPVVQAACVTASQGSVASDRGSRNLQDEMDAERRSLFITDLDTSYVHALLGRASVNQAPSLLEMIYRHLIFEPFFIWKTTGPDGPPVQHMAFHLPYYAWRTSSVPRNDPRRYHNGNRLRNVPGKFISDDQFRDPRVYFLEVCSVRLKQIAGETRPFVEKLRDSVATYEQTHLELRKSHGKISPKEAEDHEVKVREAENYVLQARGFTFSGGIQTDAEDSQVSKG